MKAQSTITHNKTVLNRKESFDLLKVSGDTVARLSGTYIMCHLL